MTATYEQNELFHLVERVYAQSLLELAEAAGKVELVGQQVAELRDLVRSEPDMIRLLSGRTLSLDERDRCCVLAFGGRIDELVLRFLRVLVRRNRFDEFPGIASAFVALSEAKYGVVEVQTYSAQPLPPDSLQRIRQRTHELTGRDVLLHEHLEPDLLGGLKVRIGDVLVDGSVAAQVRMLKQQMLEQGAATVRRRAPDMISG